MAYVEIDGNRIRYELAPAGEIPLVMVHGSWASHEQWDPARSELAPRFRTLAYDRRGHSDSESPPGQGSVREDVDDLARLIEELGLAPAWVAGNSFGSVITLRLASARPDLVRGITIHEPPLFALLAADPATAGIVERAGEQIGEVAALIASGDHAAAADLFMTDLALAPGEWEGLPEAVRGSAIANAPTFLDELTDTDAAQFDLAWFDDFSAPVLATIGDQSPAWFALGLDKLLVAMPHAKRLTFAQAGHLPHVTHPQTYADAIASFIAKHEDAA